MLGEHTLRGALKDMVGKRLDAASYLRALPSPLWPVWEERLLEPIKAFVEDAGVCADFDELLCVRDEGLLAQAEVAGDKLAGPLGRRLVLWGERAVRRGKEMKGTRVGNG